MEVKAMKSITLEQMRAILSDEIERIRSGKATPASVNAISNASGKILSTIKLELEYAKLVGKTPNIGAMIEAPADESDDARGMPTLKIRA